MEAVPAESSSLKEYPRSLLISLAPPATDDLSFGQMLKLRNDAVCGLAGLSARRNQIELDDEITASRQSEIPGRTSKEKRQGRAYLGRRRSPRRWRVMPNCSWNAKALRKSRSWSTVFGFFAAMMRRFFAVCSKAINS